MFEQDYIMRLIKEMVRAILKLLFNIDTDSPSTDLLKETEDKAMLESLMNMIDDGRIDEAENKIYEITEERDKKNLEIAILFYSYLNDKSDAFLEEHNFNREEVRHGLKDVLSGYGIDSFAEMILL